MLSIVYAFCIIVFILIIMNNIREWESNNNSPEINAHAIITHKKRRDVSHVDANNMVVEDIMFYATFRFDSGDSSEFRITRKDYYNLSEGKSGMLYFKGTRYLRFVEE